MRDLEIPWADDRGRVYRFFEMLPGILSYTVLLLPVAISVFNTTLAAYFLIAYVLIWVMKSAAMSTRVLQGHSRLKQAAELDWLQMIDDIKSPEAAIEKKDKPVNRMHAGHYRNIKSLIARGGLDIDPDGIVHAVMIATYNEPPEIIEPTIDFVLASHGLNKTNVALFLAYEDRAGSDKASQSRATVAKYKDKFLHATAIKHTLKDDEIVGKGSNANHAGKAIQRWAKKQGIDPANVLVTVLDSDNRPDVNYFASLIYTYCLATDRKKKSYQPVALFINNVWDVPAIARVSAVFNTYCHTGNSMRLHALRNFSAHAQSLESLIDTNFWSGRTIVEDGHQFWRSYVAYNGDYETLPLYTPIYQDAVYAGTYKKTIIAQFRQIRRWTYGASDVAYLATKSIENKKMPRMDALFKFARLLEGHVGWATSAPLILLAGWIPLVFAVDSGNNIVAQQLPSIIGRINTLALVLLFILMYVGMITLPSRPEHYSRWRYLAFIWQWILMPVSGIIFNSFAALTTQTRLLFGFYLERFDVTEKVVKKRAS